MRNKAFRRSELLASRCMRLRRRASWLVALNRQRPMVLPELITDLAPSEPAPRGSYVRFAQFTYPETQPGQHVRARVLFLCFST